MASDSAGLCRVQESRDVFPGNAVAGGRRGDDDFLSLPEMQLYV
jgi:hypothetical protein